MKDFYYFTLVIPMFLASSTNCEAQVFSVTNRLDMARDEIVSISIKDISPAISQENIFPNV